MKVLLLSTLVALVAADSCSDCTAVVEVIRARLTSDESVNAQIDLLVAGLCPETIDAIVAAMADPDGAICGENPNKEDCAEGVDFIIRNGLPLLATVSDGSQFPMVCNAAVEGTCAARRFAKLF